MHGSKERDGNVSTSPSSKNQPNAEKSFKSVKSERPSKKPIVCHGCGEPGHIRPNCPNRVRIVKSPGHSKVMVVSGYLAGCQSDLLRVDTGAERTVVRDDFIPKAAYTGDVLRLDSWRGNQCTEHKLASISIQVGDVTVQSLVAVVEKLDCPALLGSDLGVEMTKVLMRKVVAQLDGCDSESRPENESVNEIVNGDESIRVTRAQAKKDEAKELEDDVASAQAECQPIPMGDIFDFPDAFFELDPVPTSVDELDEWPESVSSDLPLPGVGEVGSVNLRSEQELDVSLKQVWQLGLKNEKGYCFEKGVLVQYDSDGFDDSLMRVVVPSGRRKQVLRMAHSNVISGHFGIKKTFSRINRNFLWPKMWSQVKAYVRSCTGCQKNGRQDKARAPLQPLPVISEPFTRVAFDLVGPLPRTTSGYKYLLTAMCMFTKFPEAVPLKKVDNLTVLEAMMEIFSRYGIPTELLTDQGSVFTSRLTRHMCKTFEVHKIQTSPYHPQTDGSLERWHACLKGMLKRAEVDLKEWDKMLKYVLFAYRDTPHCVTGFSPFQLMFGREVRGPLDFLKTSWVEGDDDVGSVEDWLLCVRAKMGEMAELVSDREVLAKAKMKKFYDRSATVKSFAVGDMVLVKRPLLHKKMGCHWEGPFEIEEKVSPVTYRIKLPGSKSKILHCNLLKVWHTPVETLHRVVCISDDEEDSVSSGLKLLRDDFVPSVDEQAMLDDVLDGYGDVLCDLPGRTEAAVMSIRTGEHGPVRSHPYRIPPLWKDEVKGQIDQLLALGIIRPSTSPWSSSVVLAKKKDGGIRPCIDFRAINLITEPDPYQMPLIEEILEMLASAKFISKIDLTKGFHQIPIRPDDCPKTAFCTPWGKFEFCYMPFGLRNGPAVFQRLMDSLLHKDKEFSQVYIDDIAVFSTSWEEHCTHIGVVLGRLQSAGLTANVKKCQWAQTQVEFLGHLVGSGRVSPAELKVLAVKDFPLPQTKKSVRRFLGLTGYYRRFIPNYAEHSFNLTEATRKTAPDRVILSDVLLCEISYLKDALCRVPSLTLAVPTDVFLLQTDTSGVGLGAVLSVVRDGEELPVAFFSQKLLPRERKYSASELEALAVVVAVSHFQPYLITKPFTIETDHKALVFINSANHQNSRLARWAMLLQPYSFTVRYRPGPQNVNADVLSRLYEEQVDVSVESDSSLPGVFDKRGGGRCYEATPQTGPPNMGRPQTASPDSASDGVNP